MVAPVSAGGRVMSFLPMAHIAERMAHHYIPTIYAGTVTCCPNPREILAYLPQVRPDWFFAVPRIWEKLKAGLEAMLAGRSRVAALYGQALAEIDDSDEACPRCGGARGKCTAP